MGPYKAIGPVAGWFAAGVFHKVPVGSLAYPNLLDLTQWQESDFVPLFH
jgi:hypothetical protein